MSRALLLFCFAMLLYAPGWAQGNERVDSSASGSVSSASDKLLRSLKENRSKEEIAQNYHDLAQELVKAGDLSKAESYMSKAVRVGLESKSRKKLAEYYRALAKIQEMQNKHEAASLSYEKAAEHANDFPEKQLNANDAARLKHKHSPKQELEYLHQNSIILSNSNNQFEKYQNLKQRADVNLALNQNDLAMENYREALTTVDSTSNLSLNIRNEIAELLAAGNEYQKAIDLQKEVVKEAQENANAVSSCGTSRSCIL
jgi:two-component system, sensor histidine kinase YesM